MGNDVAVHPKELEQPHGHKIENRNSSNDYIKMLCLNVCGIKSKLLLDDFVKTCLCHDILMMCETKCDDVDNVAIETFFDYTLYCFRSK